MVSRCCLLGQLDLPEKHWRQFNLLNISSQTDHLFVYERFCHRLFKKQYRSQVSATTSIQLRETLALDYKGSGMKDSHSPLFKVLLIPWKKIPSFTSGSSQKIAHKYMKGRKSLIMKKRAYILAYRFQEICFQNAACQTFDMAWTGTLWLSYWPWAPLQMNQIIQLQSCWFYHSLAFHKQHFLKRVTQNKFPHHVPLC